MQVSPKAYKIWKVLFKRPNEWISMTTLSCDVNMSNRQISSVIQTMNCPNIVKSEATGNQEQEVMLKVTDEEFRALWNEVMRTYHGIDDTVLSNIRATLSPVGWTSAKDISLMTGYRGFKVYVAISQMDDVISKNYRSSKMYMLCT